MRKIKILSITILLIIAFGIINTVNGAIAIKEAGNTVLTGKTISEFFDMALQMKDAGQALEGTSLDPHMATNKEWAAVSYLSNSNYGTAGKGKSTGMAVTINGNSHYSTNDNITGVIDWGKNRTFTAGIISTYENITDETVKNNGKSIIDNIGDANKVDTLIIDGNYKNALAATGWFTNDAWGNWFIYGNTRYNFPYSVRKDNFGIMVGGGTDGSMMYDRLRTSNGAAAETTFRPVL